MEGNFQSKYRISISKATVAHILSLSLSLYTNHRKTSDLIPLCHPLPLDQVQIDIRMSPDNTHEIIVECTCRVTHKTGVEMEALTGASVAALTIYDMVKAVSHRVEITSTKLLSKTGGKRNVGGPKPADET